jgi:uncharacterized protein
VALSIDKAFATVTFDRDEQGKPVVLAKVQVAMQLECQRCLGAMDFPIDLEAELQLVWDEAEAKALPTGREAWIVGEGEADLAAILEEEILLALPVVPKHEEDCVPPSLMSSGDEVTSSEEQVKNPFSVLADLKSKP